jgi:ATP-dependent Clp protease ATP-binding subunit ClpC
MNLGLKLEEVREEVLNLLGRGQERAKPSGAAGGARPVLGRRASGGAPGRAARQGQEQDPALDSFGRDLTELAREGSSTRSSAAERDRARRAGPLPPHQEQPRAPRRGGRGQDRDRRGPGPAHHRGDVPEILHEKRLVVLDLAMMVAGTKYRGQFEERIKAVMNEVRAPRT